MNRKLIFFINPVSGVRSKLELEKKIIHQCEKEKAGFEILFTSKDGNYSFLPDKIRKECITDIVICGGDGSISPIISHLLEETVNVGIVPLGSGNGLARTAGIPYDVDKALEIIFSGTPVSVDAFTVNGRLGCQITGLGFDAFIAGEFAKERKRGLSTYTRLAVKHFLKAKSYEFSITSNGGSLRVKAFILCISNANQFGNNLKIAPKASLSDGKLDVVILKNTNKLNILASFVNHLLFAKKEAAIRVSKNRRKVIYFEATEIAVQNPGLAPIHIDGDPLMAEENYHISVLPAAYKLIHPMIT